MEDKKYKSFDEYMKRPLWPEMLGMLRDLRKGGQARKEVFDALSESMAESKERGLPEKPEDRGLQKKVRRLIRLFVGKDAAEEFDGIVEKHK